MKYCLAIDQGGTKTDAIVFDSDGNILSKGQAPGCCYIFSDINQAMGCIKEAAERAFSDAKITASEIDLVVSCMTGADWDFEREFLKQHLIDLFDCENVVVENDCIGALRGGSHAQECGIICMGTGGNIALRNKSGEQFIFGYYLSEGYQGASSLGKMGFDAVMNAFSGIGKKTSLTQSILEYTGAKDPEDLLIKVTMKQIQPEYKNISPLVFSAVEKGDEVSKNLIACMAKHFYKCVVAGASRLNIDLKGFELVLSGGMFKGKGYLMRDEIAKLFSKNPGIKITDGRYEPVAGAGLLGLDSIYGKDISVAVLQRFEQDCEKMSLHR